MYLYVPVQLFRSLIYSSNFYYMSIMCQALFEMLEKEVNTKSLMKFTFYSGNKKEKN